MRTVQGAALDGLRARVRALGAEAPDRRTPAAPGFGARLRGFVRTGTPRATAAALRALRARRGDAPALLRTRSGRTFLVLLDPLDLDRFYAEPVSLLAADPPEKCRGTAAEEPAGIGCSRGELRAQRRRINEETLAAGVPVHPSCATFLAAVAAEAPHLTAARTLDLVRARHAVHRAARRIVLGEGAASDEELAGWLRQLRGGRIRSARGVYAKAHARIQHYAAGAGDDTLVGRATRRADPGGALDPLRQAHHWLLAMDAVPATLLNTLLLLGAHPAEQDAAAAEAARGGDAGELPRLRACVREALRLYPVVPDLIRVTRAETEWRGVRYPPGTSVLLPAAFHQRAPERVPAAHVFVPGRWKSPDADQDIRIAPFSHGGGRCPGDQLGLMITAAFCAEVLRGHRLTATRPVLDPVGPLPATLDPGAVRITLTRR
ncbi:cytochrome P450 [Streptomyces sp. NPDC059835]|uniref:cytochrome P450 n=1 Tax=Streptomyces sp. NPDC059835 TaxID=3346967 RepID=UPI00365E6AC1